MEKRQFELWAIDSNWNTIADFDTFEQADKWSEENDYFQIIYRCDISSPIRVFK